jgi:hypothetical protein
MPRAARSDAPPASKLSDDKGVDGRDKPGL